MTKNKLKSFAFMQNAAVSYKSSENIPFFILRFIYPARALYKASAQKNKSWGNGFYLQQELKSEHKEMKRKQNY